MENIIVGGLSNTVSGSYSFATGSGTILNNDITPKWEPLIQNIELKLYMQSIRIIELENKMTKEECDNLRAMLKSNDEASVILAKEIIDNVEQ